MAKYVLGTIVAVPTAGALGLGAYITFRVKTQPPDHVFRPLVNADGSLIVNDNAIPAPSRWQLFVRVVEILWIFTPLCVMYYFMNARKEWHRLWLHWLLTALERAGPAYVKAGQWVCTRRDLFSDDVREVLSTLFTEVSVHPFAETLQIIEEDFQTKLSNVFSRIDEKAIGSGSIGQVHLAYMKDTDEKVVVKVMHPRVIETIAKDFYIINGMARLANRCFASLRHYDMCNLALAWTNHLAAQLDFRIECQHLELFRSNFEDVDYVDFPRPIRATQRVLVETFAKGDPAVPEFLKSHDKNSRDIIASKVMDAWCKMMFRDNFVHGDLHPGNILVDVSDPHKPKVTLIDVGLCQMMSRMESKKADNLMSSLVEWNPAMTAETLLGMGTNQTGAMVESFKRDLVKLFSCYDPAIYSSNDIVFEVQDHTFRTLRDNYVTMDAPYCSLLFNTMVTQTLVTALNPDYNMILHTAPWLVTEGHMSQQLVVNTVKSFLQKGTSELRVLQRRVSGALFPAPRAVLQ